MVRIEKVWFGPGIQNLRLVMVPFFEIRFGCQKGRVFLPGFRAPITTYMVVALLLLATTRYTLLQARAKYLRELCWNLWWYWCAIFQWKFCCHFDLVNLSIVFCQNQKIFEMGFYGFWILHMYISKKKRERDELFLVLVDIEDINILGISYFGL